VSEWRIERRIIIHGVDHSGWLPSGASEPQRTPDRSVEVWIAQRNEGYFLCTADGGRTFDSWHPSLEETFAQAKFQYGIVADEWFAVSMPPN
jgi:hypothetical protein